MNEDADGLEAFVKDELPRIIALVQGSRVRELELKSGDVEVRIERAASLASTAEGLEAEAMSAAPAEPQGPHIRTVAAPLVGVFYHSEQPGRAALVEEGSHVERGSLIGVIEALQVLTEVESDATGVVQRVVAEDGQSVEFGQALVEILVD